LDLSTYYWNVIIASKDCSLPWDNVTTFSYPTIVAYANKAYMAVASQSGVTPGTSSNWVLVAPCGGANGG